MVPERINDPKEISTQLIDRLIAKKGGVVIQFSKPMEETALLREVDALCRKHGDALEVRFYGYYSELFDASVLRHIPNVQNLSLDCLMRTGPLDALFGLTKLTKLSLGIYELRDSAILTKIGIRHLREFSIGETKTTNIDLSPLAQCRDLATLRIEAQAEGIEATHGLAKLTDLTLRRIGKNHSISFVSRISKLKRLKVILGGRSDIDEISHEVLEELEIIWIRGLSRIGDLGRFPSLGKLWIEDQLQLRGIDLATAPVGLRRLSLLNCKNLGTVGSLVGLPELEEVVIARTAINFDALVAGLPKSVHTVRFWEGRRKRDVEIRAKLDALGYQEFNRPDVGQT
jgi:hypothetical protein